MNKGNRPGEGLALAWAVHLLTASGALFALLALLAVEQGKPSAALGWLGVALIVDGVDGTLARKLRVRERLPNFDGAALDLVVDYLTYVFVPALLIWKGGYLPPGTAVPLTAAILLSSLYVFARRDMKTDDGYFRGFPALWNVVALYCVVLNPPQSATMIAVIVLTAMTFAPIHVVHPFRVRDYGWTLPSITVLWALATGGLLLPNLTATTHSALVIASLAPAAILLALGLVRSVR